MKEAEKQKRIQEEKRKLDELLKGSKAFQK